MAHLYSLKIHHYRGVQNLETTFGNTKYVVLIGRGDSGKTTILKAISAVLCPNWNMGFNDWDFYNCDTSAPIVIEAVLKDLPYEFIKQNKYGLCLGLLNKDGNITYEIEDVPEEDADNYEKILTIRLTVSDDLEPKWHVISGPNMDIENEISASDRAKLKMYQVSDYIDNHFSYSKGSPLYSLIRLNLDDNSTPGKKIVEMVRNSYQTIANSNSFSEFDDIQSQILTMAKNIGLDITDLTTMLEFKENAYSESNISLHSNNIPYRLHGKGSKRLLSIAIQKGLVAEGGIVLIDEIEQGMESFRVRNLVRLLKNDSNGQVFITTHSKDVLVEASTENVFLMCKNANELKTFEKEYQGTLRAHPEVFFAKRVICCEGKTEYGIIRALDTHLLEKRGFGLASQGIAIIECGGGDNFYKYGLQFKENGYDACAFADDDNPSIEKSKKKAIDKGLKAILCDEGKAIEHMLFGDLPWDGICKLIEYAKTESTGNHVYPILTYSNIEAIIAVTDKSEQAKIREECANRAGTEEWFKRIDHGEAVGKIWFDHVDALDVNCGLRKEYDDFIDWIGNDID